MAAATIAIGTGLSIIGNIQANRDEAKALRANADLIVEQSEFLERSGEREVDVLERREDEFIASQTNSFGKAGVDLSGSALLSLARTNKLAREEIDKVKRETKFRKRLSLLQAEAAESRADKLTSFDLNALQVGGTLLSGGGNVATLLK